MEKAMTNEEALKILENATGMLQLNRNDHQIIANALNTLRSAVNPKSQEKDAPKAPAPEDLTAKKS